MQLELYTESFMWLAPLLPFGKIALRGWYVDNYPSCNWVSIAFGQSSSLRRPSIGPQAKLDTNLADQQAYHL